MLKSLLLQRTPHTCISRALNVKPIEMCPSSRCPVRRPRLCWLSWKLTAVGHYTVELAKKSILWFFSSVKKGNEPQLGSIQDGLAQQTLRCHHWCRPAHARRHLGHLLGTSRVTGTHPSVGRKTASNFHSFSSTPVAERLDQLRNLAERERPLGFSTDHSRPAMSTSAKKWELENARLRLLGSAAHTGLLAYLFADLLRGSKISANRGIDIIREILQRQKHTGDEVRRLAPLEPVQRGGNGEKFMALRGSTQGIISTCWNFEQLSMGSSVVYGPHQTFIPKLSSWQSAITTGMEQK